MIWGTWNYIIIDELHSLNLINISNNIILA